jgi:hypothetical protein
MYYYHIIEPGVDSARSQAGRFIRGKEPRVSHSEETSDLEFREMEGSEKSDAGTQCVFGTGRGHVRAEGSNLGVVHGWEGATLE